MIAEKATDLILQNIQDPFLPPRGNPKPTQILPPPKANSPTPKSPLKHTLGLLGRWYGLILGFALGLLVLAGPHLWRKCSQAGFLGREGKRGNHSK
eukprot:227604-Amorphochlora_amoeboformis.AAC.1